MLDKVQLPGDFELDSIFTAQNAGYASEADGDDVSSVEEGVRDESRLFVESIINNRELIPNIAEQARDNSFTKVPEEKADADTAVEDENFSHVDGDDLSLAAAADAKVDSFTKVPEEKADVEDENFAYVDDDNASLAAANHVKVDNIEHSQTTENSDAPENTSLASFSQAIITDILETHSFDEKFPAELPFAQEIIQDILETNPSDEMLAEPTAGYWAYSDGDPTLAAATRANADKNKRSEIAENSDSNHVDLLAEIMNNVLTTTFASEIAREGADTDDGYGDVDYPDSGNTCVSGDADDQVVEPNIEHFINNLIRPKINKQVEMHENAFGSDSATGNDSYIGDIEGSGKNKDTDTQALVIDILAKMELPADGQADRPISLTSALAEGVLNHYSHADILDNTDNADGGIEGSGKNKDTYTQVIVNDILATMEPPADGQDDRPISLTSALAEGVLNHYSHADILDNTDNGSGKNKDTDTQAIVNDVLTTMELPADGQADRPISLTSALADGVLDQYSHADVLDNTDNADDDLQVESILNAVMYDIASETTHEYNPEEELPASQYVHAKQTVVVPENMGTGADKATEDSDSTADELSVGSDAAMSFVEEAVEESMSTLSSPETTEQIHTSDTSLAKTSEDERNTVLVNENRSHVDDASSPAATYANVGEIHRSKVTENSDSAVNITLGSGARSLMNDVLTDLVLDIPPSGKPRDEASADARLSGLSEATENSDSPVNITLGSGARSLMKESVLTKSVVDLGPSGKPRDEASADAPEATDDSDSADGTLGSGARSRMKKSDVADLVLDIPPSGKLTDEASADGHLSDLSEATDDSDSPVKTTFGPRTEAFMNDILTDVVLDIRIGGNLADPDDSDHDLQRTAGGRVFTDEIVDESMDSSDTELSEGARAFTDAIVGDSMEDHSSEEVLNSQSVSAKQTTAAPDHMRSGADYDTEHSYAIVDEVLVAGHAADPAAETETLESGGETLPPQIPDIAVDATEDDEKGCV